MTKPTKEDVMSESIRPSGKFVVRVPRTLHRDIKRMAEAEGVSMNAFVNSELAKYVSRKSAQPTPLVEYFGWKGALAG